VIGSLPDPYHVDPFLAVAAEVSGQPLPGESCLNVGCRRPVKQFGICGRHFAQFERAEQSLPAEDRQAFRRRCVDAGYLTPDALRVEGSTP